MFRCPCADCLNGRPPRRQAADASDEYVMALHREAVSEQAVEWGMDLGVPECLAMCEGYTQTVVDDWSGDWCRASAIVFNDALAGVSGCLVAVSNRVSDAEARRNEDALRRGECIEYPYWLYFDVMFLAGQRVEVGGVFMVGLHHEVHGGRWVGNVWDWLERPGMIGDRLRQWRWYAWCDDERRLRVGMRSVLQALHVEHWVELTVEHSMTAYRGLDFYMRTYSGLERPQTGAWFTLATSVAVMPRVYVNPRAWWEYDVNVSLPADGVADRWDVYPLGLRVLALLLRAFRSEVVRGHVTPRLHVLCKGELYRW